MEWPRFTNLESSVQPPASAASRTRAVRFILYLLPEHAAENRMGKNDIGCHNEEGFGAVGRTRTGMGYPIRPSNVRVYQFHHDGISNPSYGVFAGAFGAGGALGAVDGVAVAGAGVGNVAGTFWDARGFFGPCLITDVCGRLSTTASARASAMNATKKPVVSLCRNVVAPRGPNVCWDPPPPKAPARSAPRP